MRMIEGGQPPKSFLSQTVKVVLAAGIQCSNPCELIGSWKQLLPPYGGGLRSHQPEPSGSLAGEHMTKVFCVGGGAYRTAF